MAALSQLDETALSPLQRLSLLSDDERAYVLAPFSAEKQQMIATAWELTARPQQLPPAWNWDYWVLLGGRGSGKTRPAAEVVHQWAMQPIYVALIGETVAEVRDVMIEGPSGLLATMKPWNPCEYFPSKRRLTWASGAWGTTFSGDSPDQLRGPNANYAWLDEMCKFQYPQATFDNLEMILRAGEMPQGVISTTPRPIPVLKKLMADTNHVHVSRYSTYANAANLAPSFISRILRTYEGTRLGRQELHAEILDDNPGALWNRDLIERNRVTQHPPLRRIVIAVDPGHDAGIVAAGIDAAGIGYVLEDLSLSGTPTDWARQSIAGYHRLKADRLVAEHNHGGDMVFTTIQTIDAKVVPKMVWASKGKYARAEPISALAEQGRIKHVGMCAALEDQLCLAGETLVACEKGAIPLMQVKAGDMAWTRTGLHRVLWAGCTNTSASVYRLHMKNGSTLVATMGHPVYSRTQGRFIPLREIKPNDTLEIWPCLEGGDGEQQESMDRPGAWESTGHKSNGMDDYGALTIAAITGMPRDNYSTEPYGKRLMALSRAHTRSIMSTAIDKTTFWGISRWSPGPSMPPFNIVDGQLGLLGNEEKAYAVMSGTSDSLKTMSARIAVQPSLVDVCGHDGVRGDVVENLVAIEGCIPVYNLVVEECHEFYANGILVHNCDWVPDEGLPSPDRLDAMVWAFTELMLDADESPIIGPVSIGRRT